MTTDNPALPNATATAATPPEKPGEARTRVGAPPGNRNAIRHGLTCGRLPKGCSAIEKAMLQFRRAVEDQVAELRGGNISLYDAALINSAMRHERHAMLSQRWLWKASADELTVTDRIRFSSEIGKASDARDKALKLLGLDVQPDRDPFAFLDSAPPKTPPPPAAAARPAPNPAAAPQTPPVGRVDPATEAGPQTLQRIARELTNETIGDGSPSSTTGADRDGPPSATRE